MQITLINPPICLKDVYGKFEKLASFRDHFTKGFAI